MADGVTFVAARHNLVDLESKNCRNHDNLDSFLFTLLQGVVHKASLEQLTPLTVYLPQWQILSTLNSHGGHSSGWQSR